MSTSVHSSHEAARRLEALAAWRWGAVAAAALIGALTVAGDLTAFAAALALAVAILLGSGAQLTRQVLLEEWTLRDDLDEVPDIARARRRLVTDARRRELAGSLRAIAAMRSVSRHEVAPMLLDRVGSVRADLLAVADGLERVRVLDPRTAAEIQQLITDGARSPLLNAAVPERELSVALRRIRFRLETAPAGDERRAAR
jgi:hypothetical protein